jgi:hypothetical protein
VRQRKREKRLVRGTKVVTKGNAAQEKQHRRVGAGYNGDERGSEDEIGRGGDTETAAWL